MAQIMTKRGNLDNVVTYEFVCDTLADLQAIDPQYITMGSVATVISGTAGFEVYMANSQKEWVNLGSAANSSGDSSGNDQNNESIESDKVILGPYTGKIIDYDNIEAFQRNIVVSNNTITGKVNTYNYDRGYLYLQLASKNYFYSTYYTYPELLFDMTKDIYRIFLKNNENLYSTENVYIMADNVLNLNIAQDIESLIITKFTPSDWQTLSNMDDESLEFSEYIASHIIEEYDLTQIQMISDNEWDQAGE